MTTPGTSKTILRSLAHLDTPRKGAKFAFKGIPTIARSNPRFVQPRDRIAFWNIVPGDIVRVKTGKVGERPPPSLEELAAAEGSSGSGDVADSRRARKIRGEGKVVSIDRERNLVWLRDVDEESTDAPQLAPRALRHVVPRLIDPEEGESKGYSPNVMEVPRPVHYSNLALKIPETLLGKDDINKAGGAIFAKRLTRGRVIFNRKKRMYLWRRYATYENPSSGAYEKIEVPWPSLSPRRRIKTAEHAGSEVVDNESWIPWRPEDPVFLPPEFSTRLGRQRSTSEGEAKAEAQVILREAQQEALLKKTAKSEAPDGADTYAGFSNSKRLHAKLTRPPPIAQPPTPSETLALSRNTLAAWSQDSDVQNHVQQYGGRAFSAADYLNLAPSFGPVAGGNWSGLRPRPPVGSTLAEGEARDEYTGTLKNVPSQDQVDAFPIELMMKKDLIKEGSRARRTKWWHAKQAEKAEEDKEMRKMEQKNLEALRSLKL